MLSVPVRPNVFYRTRRARSELTRRCRRRSLTGESVNWKYSTADLFGGEITLTAKSIRAYPGFRVDDLALQLNLYTEGCESTIISFEITDITAVEDLFPTVARMIGFILREYSGDCILHDEQGIHAGLIRKGSPTLSWTTEVGCGSGRTLRRLAYHI